jgi:hypothetical protein
MAQRLPGRRRRLYRARWARGMDLLCCAAIHLHRARHPPSASTHGRLPSSDFSPSGPSTSCIALYALPHHHSRLPNLNLYSIIVCVHQPARFHLHASMGRNGKQAAYGTILAKGRRGNRERKLYSTKFSSCNERNITSIILFMRPKTAHYKRGNIKGVSTSKLTEILVSVNSEKCNYSLKKSAT